MPAARLAYDHRIRLAIATSGDPTLFRDVSIPESTRRSWTTRPAPNVVALHDRDRELVELHVAMAQLESTNARLRAVIRLLLALVSVHGGRLFARRVPDARHKERLLAAVHRAAPVLGRAEALRVLGLTSARVWEWERRALQCQLEDAPSCPQRTPQQLTPDERRGIRQYVHDVALRHLSITSLALLAARRSDVVASAATWGREIRRQCLMRPRKRIHPRSPKIGVRASAPNEIWHVDASRVRLMNGTVVWIHGIIDNYSRKILAWTIGGSCKGDATAEMLRQAVTFLPNGAPPVTVVTDGGSENVAVADERFSDVLRRVRALVDVSYSNSLIENFWSQLKHRWLYLHELDSATTVERLVGQFVADHNVLIPRAALGGRTPDEAFANVAAHLPQELAALRVAARRDRVRANKSLARCGGCDDPGTSTPRKEGSTAA